MITGTRAVHDFCWINVMTKDGGRARAFFTTTLGWAYGEMPGVTGGQLILVDGAIAGAVMDLDLCALPPGTPPRIGVMIKVADADTSVARVRQLGGTAEAPLDVLDNGRMAICADPDGAVFGLWQAKAERGIGADCRAPGAPSWFETLTTDAARVAGFYTALFGWTVDHVPIAEGRYTRFSLGARQIAGAMPILPRMGAVAPCWSTYFAVADADETARVGVAAGGTLCMPVQPIPDVGRFAMLRSPQGVAFYIIEYGR